MLQNYSCLLDIRPSVRPSVLRTVCFVKAFQLLIFKIHRLMTYFSR